MMIVVDEAKERSQLCYLGWGRPLLDRTDLFLIHTDHATATAIVQEQDLFLREVAIFLLHIQFVLLQYFEHRPQVLDVLLQRLAEYDDIIKIHYNEFIKVQNVAGALVSLKGITKNSNAPYRVTHVVFASSPLAIWTY